MPKMMGGLYVGDLQIKNASMLFKWWWHFSMEHEALWKRIICSIHDLNPDGVFKSEDKVAKFGLWKSICSISTWDIHIAEVTKQGMKIQIGNGTKISFWENLWIGHITLKEGFPRLFSVSIQKNKCVADMGVWQGDNWVWQLQWKRRLFQWELLLVDQSNLLIEGFTPLREKDDCHIWPFDKTRCYTTKTFVNAFYKLKYTDLDRKHWFNQVWKGLAPPRYEILLWAILWKRVNTKNRVLKWKEMSWEELRILRCIFCREELKTLSHLFLHCKFSWQLWTGICDAWDTTWVCPLEVDDAFLMWYDSHFVGFERRLWEVFFIATVTLIWELRNEVIFENKSPNWTCLVDQVFLRVGLWGKAWKKNLPYTLEEWLNNWKAMRSWKEKRLVQRTTLRLES
ncbi:uncharacterized protein LOC141588747 [Silene latifolia]|uniref:uncharacterized protein LOC141588747 n=1 Tax=Silene latifolia TaxID=37657 RepID=UPI003D76CF10